MCFFVRRSGKLVIKHNHRNVNEFLYQWARALKKAEEQFRADTFWRFQQQKLPVQHAQFLGEVINVSNCRMAWHELHSKFHLCV